MTSRRPAPDTPNKAVRRRLAPQDRIEQILNCAGQLIMDGGLTEISMERLGRDAGVSKALIYNYFPNLNDLLRTLLEREIEHLREKSIEVIAGCTDFPTLIRQTTRMYIEHIATRGSLLQRLWQEPSVAGAVADKSLHSTDEAMRYLVKQVRKEYDLPLQVAIAAVGMQMAMTEAAAQRLSDAGNSIDLATDTCVHLLLGGLARLSEAHRAAAAPARKAPAPRKRTPRPAAEPVPLAAGAPPARPKRPAKGA
jgi:AcrR family transcriptional regulator